MAWWSAGWQWSGLGESPKSLAPDVAAPVTPPALYSVSPPRRKVKPSAVPERTGSGVAEKCTGTGYAPEVPQGCPLPPLPNIQWEGKKDRPGWYAWHAPDGLKAHRNTKTYLGYVGKKLLGEWERLPKAERLASVAQWVANRRREKGIE